MQQNGELLNHIEKLFQQIEELEKQVQVLEQEKGRRQTPLEPRVKMHEISCLNSEFFKILWLCFIYFII